MKITPEAQEYISECLEWGYTYQQILYAMEDGAILAKIGMSQETSEEIHEICTIMLQKGEKKC